MRATVSLTPDGTAAEWRISVVNRSACWGLAETQFPLLRNVVKPLEADVLIPKGNWAGRLVKSYNGGPQVGGTSLRYPSSLGAQVQTCAYMIGGAGLQVMTLDGLGQVKYFEMPDFDFCIRYPCPDQGVPGAANAPDFVVETAAFRGDWWVAAKRYRAWATRQQWAAKGPLATRTDFNRQLGDIGYWMKTDWIHGSPKQASNLMSKAMSALPGIPLGVNALYLDQISASMPAPCFDKSHGHPLGGGAHKDFFLTGELLGELPTPEGLPTVDVKWNRIGMYYDSTSFKMPAVLGAVWRDFEGTKRYTVFVNISGEAQTFTYDSGAGSKTVAIPSRSVLSQVVAVPAPRQ